MDSRDGFRDMLRDHVGPALRSHGFTGSGASWRLRNDAGDWAVVHFQRSQWRSPDTVDFFVNLEFVVEPEREFMAWFEQRALAKVPGAYEHAWAKRLHPQPGTGRSRIDDWQFGGGATQQVLAREIIDTVLGATRTKLRPALDREAFTTYLRDLLAENPGRNDDAADTSLAFLDEVFWKKGQHVLLALILSESGPSEDLKDALRLVAEHVEHLEIDGRKETATRYRAVIEWATDHAREVRTR